MFHFQSLHNRLLTQNSPMHELVLKDSHLSASMRDVTSLDHHAVAMNDVTTDPLSTHARVRAHYCNVHNFSAVYDTSDQHEFECVPTRAFEDLKICIYPTTRDIWVSRYIRDYGGWELGMSRAILLAMDKYPRATFLDIGANLGSHSLRVAKYSRKVIAIEPNFSTVLRLHKSVNLNRLQQNFVLVKNAISDARGELTLYSGSENQGGSSVLSALSAGSVRKDTVKTILFDDLMEVTANHTEFVIKIDIEGSEAHAFVHSSQFFATHKIRAIFMEWTNMKAFMAQTKRNSQPSREAQLVRDLVAKLRSRGFEPRPLDPAFQFDTHIPLVNTSPALWPNDIVWIRPWPGIAFADSKYKTKSTS